MSGFALILSLCVNQLWALPQFAVRYKQTCQLCHINPTGGGMRSIYGAQTFSYLDLPINELEDFGLLDKHNPKINDNFQIGVDFRSLYYSSDNPVDGNSFVSMEGTLYTAITPADNTTVYLAKGIHTSYEAFALIEGLPLSGELRAGHFMPAYGWRFADHNTYTRKYLGFGMGSGQEDGLEIGFYPLEWEASLALTNGASGIIDNTRGKELILRAARRQSLGGFDLTLGGSWRYAEFSLGKGPVNPTPLLRCYGPFWGASFGSLAYLGEVDWIDQTQTKLAVTHYLNYLLRRGLSIEASYDFHDPDLDRSNGAFERMRLGLDYYPTGWLELLPAVRLDKTSTNTHTTGELQLHVWF
jgi:hypothetical protein